MTLALAVLLIALALAAAYWLLRRRPSTPLAPTVPLALEVSANSSRDDDGASIDVKVSVAERQSGRPADPPALEISATVGIDEVLTATPERLGIGDYRARLETQLAGPADILASVPESGLEAAAGTFVPPGKIDRLTVGYGAAGDPDGDDPFVVTVAAQDALGSSAGEGFSQFEVESVLEHELRYNACDEAELGFRSSRVGTFPAAVHERVSGLSVEAQLRFERLVVGASADLPLTGAPEGGTPFSVPVGISLPQEWELSKARLTLRTDPGMGRIASFVGARSADPSCLEVVGSRSQTGAQGTTVVLDLFRPQPPKPPARAVAILDFSTVVTEQGGDEVEGKLDVDELEADAPHPDTAEPTIEVEDPISSGGTFLCSSKKVFKGCIIYVRTTPAEGEDPITDEAIVEAHNALNRTFRDACIHFDMSIAPLTVVGPEVEERVNSNRKIARAMNHVRGALADANIPTSRDGQECLVVAILNNRVKGKGVSLSATPPDPLAPLDGTTLMNNSIFGTSRSLAHEIGHHLDGRSQDHSHRSDRDNLMTPTDGRRGTGTELTDRQERRMQGSKWLREGTLPIYYQIARY